MPEKIYVCSDVLQYLKEHAVNVYPEECCGILMGQVSDIETCVVKTLSFANEHGGNRNRRFLITPLEYMKAEKKAEESMLQLVGVYHSHPNHTAVPSQYDLEWAIPNFLYPIVSVVNGYFDSLYWWQLEDNRTNYRKLNVTEKENLYEYH